VEKKFLEHDINVRNEGLNEDTYEHDSNRKVDEQNYQSSRDRSTRMLRVAASAHLRVSSWAASTEFVTGTHAPSRES